MFYITKINDKINQREISTMCTKFILSSTQRSTIGHFMKRKHSFTKQGHPGLVRKDHTP